jgi:DNA-binding Lrp family transcriptional regulator
MDSDLAKLSYRDLADRLGISADAARMKAKRKVKAGLWRIIPGNHPSDKVMVELPATDLTERVGGERSERISPERLPRTNQPERANMGSDRLLDALSEAVSLLRPAQEHIERLHEQLIEAKEAHRLDAVDLTAAEMREMGTKAELERALFDIAALERQIAALRRPWWRWR